MSERFNLVRREALLEYASDTEWPGLEVRVRIDIPFEDYFTWLELTDNRERLRSWGDAVLVEWNMDEDDKPVPATGDGMLTLPQGLTKDLTGRWLDAMTDVPAPLSEPSNDGTTSAVPSG
jgi:hypothetical protein